MTLTCCASCCSSRIWRRWWGFFSQWRTSLSGSDLHHLCTLKSTDKSEVRRQANGGQQTIEKAKKEKTSGQLNKWLNVYKQNCHMQQLRYYPIKRLWETYPSFTIYTITFNRPSFPNFVLSKPRESLNWLGFNLRVTTGTLALFLTDVPTWDLHMFNASNLADPQQSATLERGAC